MSKATPLPGGKIRRNRVLVGLLVIGLFLVPLSAMTRQTGAMT